MRGLLILALFVAALGSSQTPQTSDERALLQTRETVWRAWFAGDESTLRALVPPDAIVFSSDRATWKSQNDVIREAREFHAAGGKLVKLSFPRTSVQRFGDAAFVYSDFVLELVENGKTSTSHGRATEVFALRNGKWVNPGWHTDSK